MRILKLSQKKIRTMFLAGKKILIVEDDNISFELLQVILTRLGAQVVRAQDGQLAIDLFDKNTFDAVLLDIRLPMTNGVEVARFIRGKSKTIPIIAQTIIADKKDQSEIWEAGCNEIITKPLDRSLLIEKLKKYF